VAYTDGYDGDGINNGKVTVMKFNGTARETVGTPGFSDGYAEFPSLAMDNGTPYVAYSDYADSRNGKVTVMKFNGTGWEVVGAAGASDEPAWMPSLFIDNGTPYGAYAY
jgi:hypothetical protein